MVAYCFEQVKNLVVILLSLNKSKFCSKMAASRMTASRMVTYFEQVKKCWLFCWLWASQKIKPTSELPWEKLDAWAFFGHHLMSVALHPGFSGLWKSPPALSSTLTRGFFLSFECLGIQFFNLHLHVTYGMPCHTRGHSHSYLGKQKISLGVAIILSICLCSHT